MIQIFDEDYVKKMAKTPDEVIAKLESIYKNYNTLTTYTIRIIGLLKKYSDKYNITKKTFDKYYEAREKYKNLQEAKHTTELGNTLTENQSKNYVSWESILAVQKLLKAKAETFQSFQDYLIVSLYTLNAPVRADYANMKIVKNLCKSINSKTNYLVLQNNPYFIFNVYKTSKFYGQKKCEIGIELRRIISEWFQKYNRSQKFLLIHADGTPMDENDLVIRIRKIFRKVIGKDVGINILRHSFINSLADMLAVSKKLEKISKDMHHNMEMQLKYQKMPMEQ
jgi:hypothetical protein